MSLQPPNNLTRYDTENTFTNVQISIESTKSTIFLLSSGNHNSTRQNTIILKKY